MPVAPFKSIRSKLISLFVVIKVVPLILLALFAWQVADQLGRDVTQHSTGVTDDMLETIQQVGQKVTFDSSRALDISARESMERLSTDLAQSVARFLYERDQDIQLLSKLPLTPDNLQQFIEVKTGVVFNHDRWQLTSDQNRWQPAHKVVQATNIQGSAEHTENRIQFNKHTRFNFGNAEVRPLYREVTFIGLDGIELLKATSSPAFTDQLQDIKKPHNTFTRAEHYWPEIENLKKGEIYVSEVIGEYRPSRIIGSYTPEAADAAGIPFEPEKSAYAGLENPLGERFQGIIRWITPVYEGHKKTGYLTLALDHDHLREFTERVSPTGLRYQQIADASAGNYAFMWDYKNRAIAHPRDFFIHGYDGDSGLPVPPWMDEQLYDQWQKSNLPISTFLETIPEFSSPSLDKKPSREQIKQGRIPLDCRYLNFSPQCQGWHQLTRDGGSGSFVIYFSGIWKLTAAASIPYYTGRYGNSDKGFGFITIGTNLDQFRQPAVDTNNRISTIITDRIRNYLQQRDLMLTEISDQMANSASVLILSTLTMIIIVIAIAVWIANRLTSRITQLNRGLQLFNEGDLSHRLSASGRDEMGQLATSFNQMADNLASSFSKMRRELAIRKENEERLRIAAVAFETIDGMCITNTSHEILSVNNAFISLTGYSEREAIGMTPNFLRSDNYPDDFYFSLREQVRAYGQWQGEIDCIKKNGHIIPVWLTITAVRDLDGKVSHYVRVLHDISEQKASEEHIRKLAFYDPLTRLPNRRLLQEKLSMAIKNSARSQSEGALLFIDLDNFKTLNDTAGHQLGDELLKQVSNRLNRLIRETDMVARFGGDEFVVILNNLSQVRKQAIAQLKIVTDKLIEQLSKPYTFSHFDHHCTVSIGITLFNDNNERDCDAILRRADLAMYKAKAQGRNGACYFDPEMQEQARQRAQLETDLHNAIRLNQLQLHYQPQVNSQNQIVGFEALARWQHPKKGSIPPTQFIPVAEDSGQILNLGFWVLETACKQLKCWQIQFPDMPLTMAVNVSARQIHHQSFVDKTLELITSTDINPSQLHLELTESILSENLEDTINKMWRLKNAGIGFALDDFGTGYSSLSYLKKLPLDYLKIDRSFVRDLLTDPSDAVLVQTIIGLARSMSLDVIAEGVETEPQQQRLYQFGCNLYQGYLYGRPATSEQLQQTLLPINTLDTD